MSDLRAELAQIKTDLKLRIASEVENAEQNEYRCPHCFGTNLNWLIQGKGKHRKKIPWCFSCHVKMRRKEEHGMIIRELTPDEARAQVLQQFARL